MWTKVSTFLFFYLVAHLVEKTLPWIAVGRIGGGCDLIFLLVYFVCEMNQLLVKYLYIQVLGSSWGLYYYRLGCVECLYLVLHLQKSMVGLLFFFFFFFFIFYFFRVLDVFQVANGNYSALFTKRRVSADDVQQQQFSSVQLS
jgi:hypothetical protein